MAVIRQLYNSYTALVRHLYDICTTFVLHLYNIYTTFILQLYYVQKSDSRKNVLWSSVNPNKIWESVFYRCRQCYIWKAEVRPSRPQSEYPRSSGCKYYCSSFFASSQTFFYCSRIYFFGETFPSSTYYRVSKQVLAHKFKLENGEKIRESLFTFYLSSAELLSIWQIFVKRILRLWKFPSETCLDTR